MTGNGVNDSTELKKGDLTMREKIDVFDCSEQILKALRRGILLNTNGDKFNTMVIGWGGLGRTWNVDTFTVYVRNSRYTKGQMDLTGEFTVSIPLDGPDARINRICGSQSGRDIDKVQEAGLTLEPSEANHTPGVRQYPLTLECRTLYAQRQDISLLPEEIQKVMYPQDVDGSNPMANREPHTAYIGEILKAYIIRD